MTVSTTTSRVEFAGDGATTTPFTTNFYFNADADVKVYLVTDSTGAAVLQTDPTEYSITGAGGPGNGTVTMVTAPAVGETLVIFHDPENKQPVDLIVAGKFQAESIETALDRSVHQSQRNRDLASRSLRLNDFDTSAIDMQLPAVSASKYFMINSAGDGISLVDGSAIDSTNTLEASTLIFSANDYLRLLFNNASLTLSEASRNIFFQGAFSLSGHASGGTQMDIAFSEVLGSSDYGNFNYVVERLDPTAGVTVTQGTAAASIPLAYPTSVECDYLEYSGQIRNVAGYYQSTRFLEMTITLGKNPIVSDTSASRGIVYRISAYEDTAKIPDGILFKSNADLSAASFSGFERAWYAGYSS